MANLIYNSYRQEELNNTVALVTDTIKVMLVTSTYTPLATHSKRNQVTNEVVGAGYTSGGITLGTKSITVVGGQARFIAANVTWSTATITARGAVIYKDTGDPANDNLVGYVDFVTDQSSTNGDFTINWSANGVLTLS
jgi:hypothetical protein